MSPNRTLQDWLDRPVAERASLFDESIVDAQRIKASHNAYISIDEGAWPEGKGTLANIPYAVKDNIDVAGVTTTAGTPFLADVPAAIDANVVSALLFEGATVIGKTNLHELAFGITSNNGEFGPVRNPLDPSRSAGGSSGGSAAAVALGNVPFALGTDTGGSITVPASFCGISGFRPTTGRYPGDGVINLSWSRDTIGIHANTVTDIAIIDRLITRNPGPGPSPKPGTIRLGVPSSFLDDLDPIVEGITASALVRLEAAGIVIVPMELPGVIEAAGGEGFNLVFFESNLALRSRLAATPGPLAALGIRDIATLAGSPDVQAVLEMIAQSQPAFESYENARRARWALRSSLAEAFENARIDAFIFPSVPVLPPLIGVDDTTRLNGRDAPLFPTVTRNSGPGSFAGAPMLAVPAGRTAGGLSVALTLQGQFGDDAYLLEIGQLIESIL